MKDETKAKVGSILMTFLNILAIHSMAIYLTVIWYGWDLLLILFLFKCGNRILKIKD